MTVQQDRAANPGVSAWVGASAGTGKTHMLTNRVLRLLLKGERAQGILCLTFTKAAAAEMANRVNSSLAGWAKASDDELRAQLTAIEEGVPPNVERIAKARRLFAEVLDVPGGLKIQTIHGFCQSLMSRFPLETGIAPHFQVMDERTAGELMHDVTARVLAMAHDGSDPGLAAALDFVSAHQTDLQFGQLLGSLTSRPAALAARDDGRIYRLLGLDPGMTAADVVADACREGAFERADLSRICQALANGTPADQQRAAAITHWLSLDAAARSSAYQAYADIYLTAKADKVRSNLATRKVLAAQPDGMEVLEREGNRLLAVATRLRAVRAAAASTALATLGRAISLTYGELKADRAVLDYDDLIAKAKSLVRGGAAWVLYKLDEGLDHILVDEAQDTNPDQWAIIEALAAEFFAGMGAKDNERTVFAVGDTKQSIYSFQGARPAEFERMRQLFRGQADTIGKPFIDTSLEDSFRSTQAVLDLVDEVFADPAASNGLRFESPGDPFAAPIRHRAHRRGQYGEAELWPVDAPPAADLPDNWEPPTRRRLLEPAETRLARRIARQIGHWLETGAMLEARGRPIRADDVLILVRRRTGFFNAMVRELKQAHVPVAGMDRMKLTQQLAVMDLLALGEFVLMPEDDFNLAVVLKSPLVGISEDELFQLAHGRRGSLWRALRGRAAEPAFGPACDFLERCLDRARKAPPYEFFAEVLDAGTRRAILRRLGADALDPMEEFLALALDYDRAHPPSMQGFIHWIKAAETEVKRELEQGKGQVRVMTVHGAKGLQAPIVFLPDTCTIPQDRTSIYWIDDGREHPLLAWPVRTENAVGAIGEAKLASALQRDQEYNRQLYVALTRAADRLYICGYQGLTARPETCWYNLAAAAFERLGAEATEIPDRADQGGNAVMPVLRFRRDGETVVPELPPARGAADAEAPAWLRAEPGPEPAPVRPLAPSRPSQPEMPVRSPMEADNRERFLRGTLLHRMLQWLPDMPPETRREAALRFLRQPGHELEEPAITGWTDEIMAVLDDPDCAALFGSGSAAEVPVTGLVGTAAISGQIDRLAVTEAEVIVADYKTNRPPPTRAEDVPALYLRQMAAYRDLLRRIYPDRPVRCALLWTDGPSLMTLPDALLDPHGEVTVAV